MRKPASYFGSTGVWYFFAILCALIFAIPFLWMLSSALKPAAEVFVNPPILISPHASLDNFMKVFQQAPFGRYMFNSFFVSSIVTLAGLIFHSMSGYALARLDFPGKSIIFIGIISTLMIPFYTILIPLAIMMRQFGWINTYGALIIPAIPHAFGIFWLRQFFLGIPRDLENSARIDGASRIGVFLHIALPLAKPSWRRWPSFSSWRTGMRFCGRWSPPAARICAWYRWASSRSPANTATPGN